MKKRTTKLSLSRETLHRLDERSLPQVAGGTLESCGNAFAPTGCDCETRGCGTTGSTCHTVTNCSNC